MRRRLLLPDRGYEYNLRSSSNYSVGVPTYTYFELFNSLTESYVTAWLDAAERLTLLGNAHYRRSIMNNLARLHSVNEND